LRTGCILVAPSRWLEGVNGRGTANAPSTAHRTEGIAMTQLVGDYLVRRLAEWGVKRVFGYLGDGINGVMGALGRHRRLIDFVQVRHEEMAALMACAHAKFTGEAGVCLATSGPGAIHLLTAYTMPSSITSLSLPS
jgi:glyoxylate carboligase